MYSSNIERSEPILYNDMTVTIPGDEAEIFKAVRHDDISMMRNQLKLNVDMNNNSFRSENYIEITNSQ
jgi:hypothetical protein